MNKFAAKSEAANIACEEITRTLKDTIRRSKAEHDALMDEFIVTNIICQADLYNRVSEKLNALVATLPKDIITIVKGQIAANVAKGGTLVKDEKSKIKIGIDVFTGKAALASVFKKDTFTNETANSITTINSEGSSFIPPLASSPNASSFDKNIERMQRLSIPSSTEYSLPPSAPLIAPQNPWNDSQCEQPLPPSISAPPLQSEPPQLPRVVALYDSNAESPQELEFKYGDVIEVLESDNAGWSKGVLRDVVGIFPSNYVKPFDS